MKPSIKKPKENLEWSRQESVLDLPLVLQSITPFTKDGQILQLSKAFKREEFALGETLITGYENLENSSENLASDRYLYLIIQGKIRLISFDQTKQREVPVQLLTKGDTFGGENVLQLAFLGYRAIAAEPVQVAQIREENLAPWLQKLPQLQNTWKTAAQTRQTLIFLKTLTELRSLSSHRLSQLLPYLEEKSLNPGESFPETHHYWLKQGQIQPDCLTPGSSWGYPNPIPPDWTAQTEVQVYQVSQSHWETVCNLAPVLRPEESSPINQPSITPRGGSRGVLPTPTINTTVQRPISPVTTKNATRESPEIEIDFPQPLKRRPSLWRNYPFIEQQSSSDCGATCLAMITQYWGKRVSLTFLRNLAAVGRSGASLKNLARAAESLGYQARPVRASLNRLIEQKNPWIAHWQGDHYVVVYRVQGDRILIADPARGKKVISREDFLTSWSGYALLLDPTERLKELPQEKPSLGRFIKLLLPYRSLGIQVILASFLIQLFGLVSPMFTQIILDKVVVNKSFTTLNVFAIGLLIFGVWSILLTAIRQYLLSYLSNRLDLTMIGGFIRHTLMLPLKFFASRHVGDILTRVNENQKIQRFLLNQVVLAWLDFLMGFVYLGLMFYYNVQLTLLILALIPPIVLLTLASTPLLRQVSRDVFNKSAAQNSSLVETITGIDTIKATASERELRWRWEDHLTSYLNVRFRSQKLGINLQAANSAINSIGSTALLWYGATLVIQDQLTIGQFVAFNMLIGKVLSPVLSLANLWDELQEVLISVERLNDIFEADPEETPEKAMLVLPRIKGEVRLENVTFRYDSDEERNTLQNIAFTAKPGQTIAIVGRSGSGKSTLVKLLQGLYLPDRGNIWIDDHDLRHISPPSLRSQLGVVPQECFLFSGTILENITLYRPEFSLEQAVTAAKLAEAHTFIQAMPLGYNTKVGERGTNLSGGQRQRIAIARALLGEPRILILDEATSSLDTESERRFQDNLARLSRDRTTFIIAHRLSTVRNADLILVLDRGVLAEQGNHQQLMANQGIYYHLAQQQLEL
ncbi:cyclic nucleotide-binding protein [Rippkaea orientalis PCC 8801]|uniref:Cyclic nucleotide-binding protein n=1 Tax=Rippkaea orientalis (strain PCC 8801 / RF-1) TaxID=41431 RepID=B7JYD5_RIPO1|nr:peptidase domain-containing ABC transporter [Rippkaea orientalis]ACK67237.1 cyclic nucleotide-binding protein [Rippkaea orientalis PCC 8801]